MDKISNLKKEIINTLDSNKALDIVSIDLEGKSSIADFMIIASGTSSRHIQSLSEQVFEKFTTNLLFSRARQTSCAATPYYPYRSYKMMLYKTLFKKNLPRISE